MMPDLIYDMLNILELAPRRIRKALQNLQDFLMASFHAVIHRRLIPQIHKRLGGKFIGGESRIGGIVPRWEYRSCSARTLGVRGYIFLEAVDDQ